MKQDIKMYSYQTNKIKILKNKKQKRILCACVFCRDQLRIKEYDVINMSGMK
jgi:hypothetical protein